jgi:preprotein translocase SecF subunit
MAFKLQLVPANTKIRFLSWRKPTMAMSVFLVVAALFMSFAPGLNFGIDFKGGTLIEVRLPQPANLGEMRSALNGQNLGQVTLQEFGQPTDVLISVQRQSAAEGEAQKTVEIVRQLLANSVGGEIQYRRVETVGPAVSGELVEAGAIAISLAVMMMLAYIWFRFEWQFGVGAVVALIHDVTLSIGFFAVTQMEFNLSTIAALLTIVGYSINDTVVVYDRVRENLRRYKTMPLEDLLNHSINDTLSRTTMTSVTTLLALIALFIFGGEVIKGFVAAMIWGVIVGTYSSVFIASPLLLIFGLDRQRGKDDEPESDNVTDESAA